MKRYKRKFEEGNYKTIFKGTKIEISNIDPALGRAISDNLTFIITKEIEKYTNDQLKVYSIKIELV